MGALKKALTSIDITFKEMIAEGSKVATVHIAKGTKPDGKVVETQINAVFEIKNNKIVLCDELTHMLQGNETDRDLGSRK